MRARASARSPNSTTCLRRVADSVAPVGTARCLPHFEFGDCLRVERCQIRTEFKIRAEVGEASLARQSDLAVLMTHVARPIQSHFLGDLETGSQVNAFAGIGGMKHSFRAADRSQIVDPTCTRAAAIPFRRAAGSTKTLQI